MSRLDELIQELCPDGVEYKAIKDIAWTGIGLATSVTKHKRNDGVVLIHNSDIRQNKITLKSFEFLDEDFVKKNENKIHRLHDIVTVHTGDVGTSAVIEQEFVGSIGFTTIITRIKDFSKVSPYYLCNYLNSQLFKSEVRKKSISERSNLNQKDYEVIQVPIPPLEIQIEIVRLLDKFTAKTAELQAELNKEYEARKKQYEYYRDTLLNDEKTTRKVTLQDVAQYSKARISSSEVNETNYVGVDNLLQNKKGKENSTHVPTSGNLTEFQSGDILIGNIRPYLQKIWLSDKTGGTNGDVLDIRPNQKLVTPPFLYQVLASDRFFNYDMQNSKGAKMPRGNKEKVMEYTFALPTLERQREIVLLLNKFEIAFNDLQSELPAEIESRQKQYEYYRDKLLTFKELK